MKSDTQVFLSQETGGASSPNWCRIPSGGLASPQTLCENKTGHTYKKYIRKNGSVRLVPHCIAQKASARFQFSRKTELLHTRINQTVEGCAASTSRLEQRGPYLHNMTIMPTTGSQEMLGEPFANWWMYAAAPTTAGKSNQCVKFSAERQRGSGSTRVNSNTHQTAYPKRRST